MAHRFVIDAKPKDPWNAKQTDHHIQSLFQSTSHDSEVRQRYRPAAAAKDVCDSFENVRTALHQRHTSSYKWISQSVSQSVWKPLHARRTHKKLLEKINICVLFVRDSWVLAPKTFHSTKYTGPTHAISIKSAPHEVRCVTREVPSVVFTHLLICSEIRTKFLWKRQESLSCCWFFSSSGTDGRTGVAVVRSKKWNVKSTRMKQTIMLRHSL